MEWWVLDIKSFLCHSYLVSRRKEGLNYQVLLSGIGQSSRLVGDKAVVYQAEHKKIKQKIAHMISMNIFGAHLPREESRERGRVGGPLDSPAPCL